VEQTTALLTKRMWKFIKGTKALRYITKFCVFLHSVFMCFVRFSQRLPLTPRLVRLWKRDLVSVRQAYELKFYI